MYAYIIYALGGGGRARSKLKRVPNATNLVRQPDTHYFVEQGSIELRTLENRSTWVCVCVASSVMRRPFIHAHTERNACTTTLIPCTYSCCNLD